MSSSRCVRFVRSAASRKAARKSASKTTAVKKASLKLRSPRSMRLSASPRTASRLTRSDIKHLRSLRKRLPPLTRRLVVDEQRDGDEFDNRVNDDRVLETPVGSPRALFPRRAPVHVHLRG